MEVLGHFARGAKAVLLTGSPDVGKSHMGKRLVGGFCELYGRRCAGVAGEAGKRDTYRYPNLTDTTMFYQMDEFEGRTGTLVRPCCTHFTVARLLLRLVLRLLRLPIIHIMPITPIIPITPITPIIPIITIITIITIT